LYPPPASTANHASDHALLDLQRHGDHRDAGDDGADAADRLAPAAARRCRVASPWMMRASGTSRRRNATSLGSISITSSFSAGIPARSKRLGHGAGAGAELDHEFVRMPADLPRDEAGEERRRGQDGADLERVREPALDEEQLLAVRFARRACRPHHGLTSTRDCSTRHS
jgi:hypothetical protein